VGLPYHDWVSVRERYLTQLGTLVGADWTLYLSAHSGLPGPRANLELARAVADVADPDQLNQLLATDDEFSVLCGTIGLGRLLAEGNGEIEERLRATAADERWRVREGVAMALQRLGDADLPWLVDIVDRWASDPDPLVQRAALAGICEPRLLRTPWAAARAVEVCERVTRALVAQPPGLRRTESMRTLRQAHGYCWSVAVAADRVAGLSRFKALATQDDPDVAWIVRENSKKARLLGRKA
jgi:HEAT repeat protein